MKLGAYERTNLSRLTQLEFLGLYVMMRLNRMWAAGANPLGRARQQRWTQRTGRGGGDLHWGSGVAGVGFEGSIDLHSRKRVSIGRIEMGREASVEIWAPDGGAADDGGAVG
jgi:hypothetical protein